MQQKNNNLVAKIQLIEKDIDEERRKNMSSTMKMQELEEKNQDLEH